MKLIKITKDFYKNLEYKIEVPTFTCKICGEEVLDCPSNWHLK